MRAVTLIASGRVKIVEDGKTWIDFSSRRNE